MSICEVLTVTDNLGKEDSKLFNKQFKRSSCHMGMPYGRMQNLHAYRKNSD